MAELTDAKLQANRANAQHSTGPRSEAGRKRSSLNALRRGLTGQAVLLFSEDREAYLKHSREIIEDLKPETPLERQLAQSVADQQWRLNRILSITEAMLALDLEEGGPKGYPETDDASGDSEFGDLTATLRAGRVFRDRSQAFVNLTTYEQRIQRMQVQTLKQLKDLQAERPARQEAQKKEAIQAYLLNRSKNLPYDPKADGFEFSAEEIKRELERQDRQEEFVELEILCNTVGLRMSKL
jgi:hypothetical protein